MTHQALATSSPIVTAGAQKSYMTCESTCTAQQVALFDICFATEDLISQAVDGQQTALRMWMIDTYGQTSPTFAQFRSDRTALKILSEERGLVDDQYARKAYNAALKALYGALPVSDSPAAQAKRASRASQPESAPKAGAVKGVATHRKDDEPRTIEQLIAKFGAAKVLEECAKVLASDESTALASKALKHWAHELPLILQKQAA